MAKYRSSLPQLNNSFFLTDGGIETTLIFHEGLDLPHFAAFVLLKDDMGKAMLEKYFRTYAEMATRLGTGLVLESPTWRANPDWGDRLGYTPEALATANQEAVLLLEAIRSHYETDQSKMVISGCIGPRGDGYIPDSAMSASEAQAYHQPQIDTFANSEADMVCAITMNYVAEAIGVAQAAQKSGIPVAISFTVETDGKLPTGQALPEAIQEVDEATTAYPAYYAINCAHPTHFDTVLLEANDCGKRIKGLRANASRMSHAELDEAPELDTGNPVELGRQYAVLKRQLNQLTVMGGCCGTDARHIEQIAVACQSLF